MPIPASIPFLVIFFGLTASGKSTLAEAFTRAHGTRNHNTDRVRKELAGLPPTTPRPDGIDQGIYTAALTEQTYQALCDRGLHDLLTDRKPLSVLDGSYGKREDRDHLRQAARAVGLGCCFFLCTCSEAETLHRLEKRRQDCGVVSDGRLEIYLYQKQVFAYPQADESDCFILPTEQPLPSLLRQADALLAQAREATSPSSRV